MKIAPLPLAAMVLSLAAITVLGVRALFPGKAAQSAASQDATAADITQPMKDAMEAYFHKTLIHPELAIWKYDFTRPYPTGGLSVCGRVNYVTSTRQYFGFLPFFAHFRGGRMVEGGIAVPAYVDVLQGMTHAYDVACGKA
jgi:hypothetical protein